MPSPMRCRPVERLHTVLPERTPVAELIILRDGQLGEPEVTLSPLRYHYQHRAELQVVVQAGTGRTSAFDSLIAIIGTSLEADRSLQRSKPAQINPRSSGANGMDLATFTR